MTARDRTVIVVVLAVAAIVAGWFFVVSPKRDQASSLNSQISSEQSLLESVSSQVAAGKAAQTAFAGQYSAAREARRGGSAGRRRPLADLPGPKRRSGGRRLLPRPAAEPLLGQLPEWSSSSSSSSSSELHRQLIHLGCLQLVAARPAQASEPPGCPPRTSPSRSTGNFFRLANFFNRLENFVVSRDDQLLISGRLMSLNAINSRAGWKRLPGDRRRPCRRPTYIVPATEGPFDGATPAGPATASQPQASTSGSSTGAPAAAITSVIR